MLCRVTRLGSLQQLLFVSNHMLEVELGGMCAYRTDWWPLYL
jgi:hypothetical protein